MYLSIIQIHRKNGDKARVTLKTFAVKLGGQQLTGKLKEKSVGLEHLNLHTILRRHQKVIFH